MHNSIYMKARDLSDQLSVAGLEAEAEGIREAMSAGATATEILMALRWNLQSLEDGPGSVPAVLKRRARQLTNSISKVLGF